MSLSSAKEIRLRYGVVLLEYSSYLAAGERKALEQHPHRSHECCHEHALSAINRGSLPPISSFSGILDGAGR